MASDIENDSSIDVRTPFFSTKIAGKNLTFRDIVLLLVFGTILLVGSMTYYHADASEKSTQALLKEVKETNQTLIQTQKNIAFHQCRTACLLSQPQEKRDSAQCDLICAPAK